MLIRQDHLLIEVLHFDIVFQWEVIWCSGKVRNRVVARSSAEATYRVIVVATCELVGLNIYFEN